MSFFHYVPSRNNINIKAIVNQLPTELKTDSRVKKYSEVRKKNLKISNGI